MTTLMTAYFATSGLSWLFLGVIWKRSNWTNAFIKFAMFILAAWSALFLFRDIIEAMPNV